MQNPLVRCLGWYVYERIVSGEVFFAKQAWLDLRARCPVSGLLIAFVHDAGFGNGVVEAMFLLKKLSVWQIESSLMQNTI